MDNNEFQAKLEAKLQEVKAKYPRLRINPKCLMLPIVRDYDEIPQHVFDTLAEMERLAMIEDLVIDREAGL